MLCRHCNENPVSRPRGLCWGCYYRPGVRELYPSTSKYARRGIGNGNIRVMLSATHTTAEPGSPEKVAVMEDRAMRREDLFHPDDAAIGGVSATVQTGRLLWKPRGVHYSRRKQA
jgi:hypothetical protein